MKPGATVTPIRSNELVTEDGAACEFAKIYRDRLRYCHDAGRWYEWDGVRWRANRIDLAFRWARELARDLAKSEPDRIRYVTSKVSFASGVERFAKSAEEFAVTAGFWDNDPFLLGTPAGPIDLRTGLPLSPDPSFGITKSTAVQPSPTVDCPRFLQFLDEATSRDAGLIRFLQQYSGYALTGNTTEHALLFIHGAGENGKSVYSNTMSGVLMDYGVTASMDVFVAAKGERHPTDLAMLHGARLVTASETEEGRAWAESKIKQITGGDPITARFMRRDNFTFRPTFKLLIVGNHEPALKNVDAAARRRFNIVPFAHKPARPDRELEKKLQAEWPGILRWMIEGCLDWQANGLVRPKSVVDATAEYFAAQDLVGHFLTEECELEPGNNWKRTNAKDLYEAWSAFAKASGEDPRSHKAFTQEIVKRGVRQGRSAGARQYEGIELRRRPSKPPYI